MILRKIIKSIQERLGVLAAGRRSALLTFFISAALQFCRRLISVVDCTPTEKELTRLPTLRLEEGVSTTEMNREDYIRIFLESHPGFFTNGELDCLEEEMVFEEMFLDLNKFSASEYDIKIPDGVKFGYYIEDMGRLMEAVAQVEPNWPQFFSKDDRIYCAFLNGEIASFCLIEKMGTYQIEGDTVKVGGPGCVGTVPKYRRQGIGLAMVQRVTGILKDEGYDCSYIHYTAVADWYSRLGYRTRIRWNKNGILTEK